MCLQQKRGDLPEVVLSSIGKKAHLKTDKGAQHITVGEELSFGWVISFIDRSKLRLTGLMSRPGSWVLFWPSHWYTNSSVWASTLSLLNGLLGWADQYVFSSTGLVVRCRPTAVDAPPSPYEQTQTSPSVSPLFGVFERADGHRPPTLFGKQLFLRCLGPS